MAPDWIGWIVKSWVYDPLHSHSASYNKYEADPLPLQGMARGLHHLQTHPRGLNMRSEGLKLSKALVQWVNTLAR
jgi:hypothetical protein